MRKFSLTAYDKKGRWFTKTMEWKNDIVSIDIEAMEEDSEPEIDCPEHTGVSYNKATISLVEGGYIVLYDWPGRTRAMPRSIAMSFEDAVKDVEKMLKVHKRERRIDKADFNNWELKFVDGRFCCYLESYGGVRERVFTTKYRTFAEAFLQYPAMMCAMIDHVHYPSYQSIERFKKIIDDAGFSSDIEGSG